MKDSSTNTSFFESNRPIHILRIIDSVSPLSSPYNQFFLPLIGIHETTLCTFFRSELKEMVEPPLFSGNNTLKGFFRALKKALSQKKYDVVHVHSPHLAVLFILGALVFAPFMLRSNLYTIHSSYSNYRFKHRLMLLLVMIFYRKIVCCSESSFGSFPKIYKVLAGKRLYTIANGVDINRIDRNINSRIEVGKKNGFCVVSVGRLIPLKNPGILLKALYRCKDKEATLVFVGDGVLKERVNDEAKRMNLKARVKITGQVSRNCVYKYLTSGDVFVSVSDREGLPVAVLEAMACRRPVILSDIPPHREIAQGTDFIPIVKPGDLPGLVQALETLMRLSETKRAAIGEKCRNHVLNHFNLWRMLREYEHLYLQLAGRRLCMCGKKSRCNHYGS